MHRISLAACQVDRAVLLKTCLNAARCPGEPSTLAIRGISTARFDTSFLPLPPNSLDSTLTHHLDIVAKQPATWKEFHAIITRHWRLGQESIAPSRSGEIKTEERKREGRIKRGIQRGLMSPVTIYWHNVESPQRRTSGKFSFQIA